jgi:LEA14-like dessication related protein
MGKYFRTNLQWLIVGCTFAALLTGCAGVQRNIESPRVTLAHMEIAQAKALETAFQIELRIFNPNDAPLKIKAVECELELNGKPFATGVSRVDVSIDAFGMDTVSVVVYSSVLDTVSRLIGLIQDAHKKQKIETLKYGVTGKLHLSDVTNSPYVKFKSEGVLDLGNTSI